MGRLAGAQADLNGEFRSITKDKLNNYPDSHRLYVWQRIIYLACVNPESGIDINRLFELYLMGPPPVVGGLDLRWLTLGTSIEFVKERLGPPLSIIRHREVYDEVTGYAPIEEHLFHFDSYNVIIHFDEFDAARSIIIGLDQEAVWEKASLLGPGDWPIDWGGNASRKWSELKFENLANEHCSYDLHQGMSMAINSAICGFTFWPKGGSHSSREDCFFQSGWTDGILGFQPIPFSDSDFFTELDLMRLIDDNTAITDDEVDRAVWSGIKNQNINFISITCEYKLLVDMGQ